MNYSTHPLAARSPECAALAPLLPLLDDETLAPEDAARVREHLTDCSACREQCAAYSRLNSGLRRHFGPTAMAPLRLEDIMENYPSSDSAHERLDVPSPSATPPLSPPPPRMPQRSRRILSGVASLAAVVIVALLAAYIFANHPLRILPTSGHGTPGVVVSGTSIQTGFSGISMVSANEGWVVGSTSTFHYTSQASSSGPGSAPPTTPVAATASADVSSSSSAAQTDSVTSTGSALLYHFQDGKWTPYTISPRIPGVSYLAAISMDSPTDGWAVGGYYQGPEFDTRALRSLLLHYDGRTWSQVAGPVNAALGGVCMLSATDGWALTEVTADNIPEILHYDGSAWHAATVPVDTFSGAGGLLNFTGLTALPDGEAWVGAVLFPQGNSGASGTSSSGSGSSASSSTGSGQGSSGPAKYPSSVILHYNGSAWTVQARMANALINGIGISSQGDGWAVGQNISVPTTGAGQSGISSPAPLFLRYAGGTWTRVDVGVPDGNGAVQYSLGSVSLLSPSDVWVVGVATTTTTTTVTSPNAEGGSTGTQFSTPKGEVALLHFDGTRWTAQAGPSLPANALPSLQDSSFISSNNGWAVGSLITFPSTPTGAEGVAPQPNGVPLILHYVNGNWTRYALP